jgi:signal transduction histidine kinase
MAMRFVLLMMVLDCMAVAQSPITRLADVRALDREEAAMGKPVEVEGTVIYYDRSLGDRGRPDGLIIHDGKHGCYVSSRSPFAGRERIRPGTRIRVTGITNPDSYFPNIFGAKVNVLGQGELHEPRPIAAGDLFSRAIDSDWVEVGAVVVGVESGGLAFTVVVEIDGRTFKAEVPVTGNAERRAAALMQRRIRLQGVVGTIYNAQWQLTGRHFFVPSFDQIIPVEDVFDGGSAPQRTIGTLLQSDHGIEEMVRVRGIVTQPAKDGFYLRDETASTFVQAAEVKTYPPGSEVEVEGFAVVAPFRPILRAVRIVRKGDGELAAPRRIWPEKRREVGMHGERVLVDCVFLAIRKGSEETVLQCRAGDRYFEARLPGSQSPDRSLASGDGLRLTGIYEVTTTRPMPRVEWVDGFRLHLADAGAVEILSRAPWWNPERILLAFGLATAALGVVFVWNWQLRRRVAVQSSIIARQVEQAAVKDERERIARELHDTLEQHMTGLAIQLGNLAPALDGAPDHARQQLSLARGMLGHCRSETRASIGDLRNPYLIGRALPEAMHESLAEAAAGSPARFVFGTEGTPQPLRATTQNHLLRIAREAVFNAARHADATQIAVRLAYDQEGVTLEITDDGSGFDDTRRTPAGHFGLVGMRERANKIHAECSIASTPGKGTMVRVHLPWSSPVAHPRSKQ